MTLLYHATDEASALSIDQEGFRCGRRGFAGGAIYFSRRPEGACRKYRNGRGNPDILIECRVNLGMTLTADIHEVDEQDVHRRGYDSVKIDGLDVYAVYEPQRVKVQNFQRVGRFGFHRSFRTMSALRSERSWFSECHQYMVGLVRWLCGPES